jgi:ATP-dependent helicase/nuclease subunit A
LTERFLSALDASPGRQPLRTLVAMTFTEKAARELRQRIRRECRSRLAGATSRDEAARWRGVLGGLEAAPVSTFHEYCAGLLRRHALEAGIDGDFDVLDATIAPAVRDEALDRCIRRWFASADTAQFADLVGLGIEYGLERTRRSLAALVERRDIDELAGWVDRSEEQMVAIWREVWEREGKHAQAVPMLRAARECVRWLTANDLDHPKLRAFRSALLEALPQIESRLGAERLTELRGLTLLPRGLRTEHWPSGETKAAAETVIKALRKQIDDFLDACAIDEAASLRAAGHGLRFARLALEAKRAYDEAKRARGGLDFNDLLLKVRDLLRRDPAIVRDDPGRPIGFVMVDEFQDTDPVQSEILRHLTGEEFALGRLFVVGDFKQSIYRFRGAQPRIFHEIRDEFPATGRLDLSVNFRSGPGVLDFINALFADAFEGETPRLLPGPRARPAGEGPAVEFVWAAENDAEGAKPSASQRRRVEARWLARLIRSRIDSGWTVIDRNSGAVRSAHGGDVAFLFRALTDLAPYELALEAEGLDYHVVGGWSFYAQQEVQDLVNVLSVIEDPLDGVALAGTLRSPFFGLSDEALFWLGGTGRGDLAAGLARSDAIEGLSAVDRRRAARARELLERWRELKDHVPIATLVDRVLDESGFEAALLGETLGDRKRANARKVVRMARGFDSQGGFTLGHFVTRLRDFLRDPPREEQAATTEEEGTSIRLMSIHQAKGLEFPIVIVPDLNRKPQASRDAIAFHPELGPLVRPGEGGPSEGEEGDSAGQEGGSGKSLGWTTYQALEKIEDAHELIRLFYVATTRARDRLILSAGFQPGDKPESPAMRLLSERFDLEKGECLAELPDGWAQPAVRVIGECPPSGAAGRSRRRRPRLRAVARVIQSAPLRAGLDVDRGEPVRPAFVDLDVARGLSPRQARLDRLVRAILSDPRAIQPGALGKAARNAARRQQPIAHEELVAEAVSLLELAVEGELGRVLRQASRIERDVAWTIHWPPAGSGAAAASAFLGRAELYARDEREAWSAVLVSLPGVSEPLERLRLLLSARVAESLNLGPAARAWHVRLGSPAGIALVECFDDEVVEQAVRDALGCLAGPATVVSS